jgi:signal peptidase I
VWCIVRTGNRRRILIFATCGLLAAAWFVWLRPVTLGGDVSYVVVQGTSMEPTYHDGDLVLARGATHFRRGDIIVYRVGGRFNDPAMVIHRIVGGNGTKGFVTRGDNRDRTDSWSPKNGNVLGRATLSVPAAGRVAEIIRQPWALALLGSAAVLADTSRRRRRRRAVVRRRQPGPIPWISWRVPPETP